MKIKFIHSFHNSLLVTMCCLCEGGEEEGANTTPVAKGMKCNMMEKTEN